MAGDRSREAFIEADCRALMLTLDAAIFQKDLIAFHFIALLANPQKHLFSD
jgi:hypothetical protein